MALTWLHVSDFHMRSGDAYDREVVLQALVSSVRRMRETDARRPDLIFATGDIAHSGATEQYAAATTFFDALLDAADLPRERLFVIPGNHDVDRNRGVGLARTLISRELADRYFAPDADMMHLKLKLAAYRAWYGAYFDGIRECPPSTCGPVERVEVGGTSVAVLPINSALFCDGDDDHAKLLVGRRALSAALGDLQALDAELQIALVHHPLDWLADIERGNVQGALAESVDIVLRGHLHATEAQQVVSQQGSIVAIAAGAAYQTRQWPNRALYGTLAGRSLELFPIRFEDSPTEIWTVDPSVFPRQPRYTGRFELAPASTAPPSPIATQSDSGPVLAQVPPFRGNIPSRRGVPVIGREDELRAIAGEFDAAEAEHVVVLSGAPGVGKSELAREVARRRRERYAGGTFLLDATSTNLLVDLARIAVNFLGMTFADGLPLEDKCEQAFAALGAHRTLLIYDNVQVLEAVVRWLPRAGMPCHVLITTVREAPAAGWSEHVVKPLTPEHSIALVEALGGAEVARCYGAELAERSGGLPVELCPLATLVAHAVRRGRSADLAPLASETHASFALVYEQLESPERLVLHVAAALNTQRVDNAGLLADLTAPDCDVDAAAAIETCVQLHLLEGDEELRMHELLAAFLASVERDDDLDAALQRARTAQHRRLVTVAGALCEAPANPELAAALLRFKLAPTDWDDLRERPSADDAGRVGQALVEIGEFAQARPWYEQAVDAKRQGDDDSRIDHASLGRSLHQVGVCHSSAGEHEQARPWFEQAVDAKRQGDVHGQIDHDSLGRSLHLIGYCRGSIGEYQQARPWFEQAVDAKRQGDVHGQIDHDSLGRSLHEVGYCHTSAGEHQQARPRYEQAVDAKRQGDVHGRIDHASLGRSLHQVGVCHSSAGEDEQARPWYEQAVDAKRQGDVHGRIDHANLGRSLHQVGYCHTSAGEHEQARPWYEQAVEAKRQGDVHGRIDHASLGSSLHRVGVCHTNAGEHEQARPWYEQAVDAKRQGDVHGRIDHASLRVSLLAGAACLQELRDHDLAARWAAEAAALAEP